ncbi:MAG: ATP-binding protein [Bacteroidales bacterium]|nr:ATP-binding protein [Bacteroidales bacterium]
MGRLIGRKEYVEELEDVFKSSKSEFVAVYGRRRIGKTFLIDCVFDNSPQPTYRTVGNDGQCIQKGDIF